MKKLRLDLDSLRVHSFATGEAAALGDAASQYESFCTSGCTRRCNGTVEAQGMSYEYDRSVCCGRGTVEAHAGTRLTDAQTRRICYVATCAFDNHSDPCNHTTA